MAYNIQVAIDCADAHAQADWWAETLGWVVEPTNQDLIDEMLAAGYAKESDVIEHNGVRVWKDGAAICRPDEVGMKGRQRVLFQPVPEPKTVKDRIHLDINLDGDDKDALRSALEKRGAKFLYQANQGPHVWYTMTDPEGNEFCIG
ncbi:VOC family protein [Arthrobacter sp. JZ12]|uniref:VOC family protein n=1 Tax=Arthrobacter sp. JZ12 TaxID=2654190 RepID=UPI002B484BF6|nr:VOC family protein [Arthrobacter sp. JZ12]WRH25738.1 VOC family protein [Arthrobacter sp. JZ12]